MSLISGKHDRVAPSARACAITDVGLQRANNEDVAYVGDDASLLVVADGLGGLPGGEVASLAAVSAVVAALGGAAASKPPGDDRAVEARMASAFERAQAAVFAAGREQPSLVGMATTLVVSLISPTRLFTCHVGDVRAYLARARPQRLEQLTTDHSLVAELVASGQLSCEQARDHPERNIVTQVLGSAEGYQADFAATELEPGDVVMLCSDGLWEAITDDEIEGVLLGGASAGDCADALLARALAADGHDNISAVVYQHR